MTDTTTTPVPPAVQPAVPPMPTHLPQAQPQPQPPAEVPAPPPRRRALRALGRWTAALAVFGLLGAGTAYGVTRVERTELPGLATADDGRWDYPELALPALPSGSPRPFDEANPGNVHHADLRDLLLPAPRGATQGEDLPEIGGGWESVGDYLALYPEKEHSALADRLRDDAVRHIAARGWSMPDGTRTQIHLLRFNTRLFTSDFHPEVLSLGTEPLAEVVGDDGSQLDESWPDEAVPKDLTVEVFDEKARGATHVRQAFVVAGDTVAVIVQSRKGEAPRVPFHQTVVLQAQLLH